MPLTNSGRWWRSTLIFILPLFCGGWAQATWLRCARRYRGASTARNCMEGRPQCIPPAEFRNAAPDPYYTTDDLLLYLTGLQALATAEAQIKRIEGLALPQHLKEELLQLAVSAESGDTAGPAETVKPQNVSGKGRPRAGSVSKSGRERPAQGRKL